MSAQKVQAIVLREIREPHAAREAGVGQNPDATYNSITPLIIELLGYFDQIVQQNPQDLIAPRMANVVTQLGRLLQQYNNEYAAVLKSASDKLAACQAANAQSATALQQTQQQAASGVSPGATAAIAVASAVVGGLAGYAVHGKMR